jgi:hypothetical protein
MMFVVRHYPRSLDALAQHINHPQLSQLPALARRFLFDQLNDNPEVTSNDVDLEDCPMIIDRGQYICVPFSHRFLFRPK